MYLLRRRVKKTVKCRTNVRRCQEACLMVLSSLSCPAVQNERDCINSQRAKEQTVGTLSISVLLQAETTVQQVTRYWS